MLFSPYSSVSLRSILRVGDSKKYGVNLADDAAAILEEASQEAESNSVFNGSFNQLSLQNGKVALRVKEFRDVLLLRALAKDISHNMKISTKSRDEIISGVIESLYDATPFFIFRRDISSFYENVNHSEILQKILIDPRTHVRTRTLVRRLIEENIYASGKIGVPRGLGFSTLLSEIALKKFDEGVRSLPTVYRYFRFSDDILIFSTAKDGIAEEIKSLLPSQMQFNEKNSKHGDLEISAYKVKSNKSSNLDNAEQPSKGTVDFTYLGYTFEIRNIANSRKASRQNRKFYVRIADEKIKLRKTRLFVSLKKYLKDLNGKDLIDRVQYLSSNFEITQNGHTHGSSNRKIKVGIYYNYKFCGEYSASRTGPIYKPHIGNELKKLDALYHILISSKKSQFARKLKSELSASQYATLTRLSFYKGFQKKMFRRFTRSEISNIMKAWNNA